MRKTWNLSIPVICLVLWPVLCAPLFAADQCQQVIELVNIERVKAGVPQLKSNPQLTESAKRYALYLGKAGFFSHTGPDGSTLITRNTGAGYRNALWLGENIAAGFSTPESTVAAWMESLPHRSNILDPNFAEIGVANAFVNGSPYGHYWVQEFGIREGMLPDQNNTSAQALQHAGRAPALGDSQGEGVVSAGGLLGESSNEASASENSKVPVITAISPSGASHGASVTVSGSGFGTSGTFRFGGLIAAVESWTDTEVVGRVPEGAISSGVTVTNNSGVISRGIGFRVTSTAPSA